MNSMHGYADVQLSICKEGRVYMGQLIQLVNHTTSIELFSNSDLIQDKR